MRLSIVSVAAATLLGFGGSALAAMGDPVSPVCSSGDITGYSGSFIACAGYFSGNLLGGSPAQEALADAELNTLLGTSLVDYTQIALQDFSGATIDFTTYTLPFTGNVVLGVHRGGAGAGSEGTAFYHLSLTADTQTLTYNLQGLSNAALYVNDPQGPPPIPEPSTYAMMLAGIAAMGLVARRRSRKS